MNKYLIALSVGGLQESPEINYENPEVILAMSQEEAIGIYNDRNNCSYFYGSCLAEKVNGKINVRNDKVSYEQVKMLEDYND